MPESAVLSVGLLWGTIAADPDLWGFCGDAARARTGRLWKTRGGCAEADTIPPGPRPRVFLAPGSGQPGPTAVTIGAERDRAPLALPRVSAPNTDLARLTIGSAHVADLTQVRQFCALDSDGHSPHRGRSAHSQSWWRCTSIQAGRRHAEPAMGLLHSRLVKMPFDNRALTLRSGGRGSFCDLGFRHAYWLSGVVTEFQWTSGGRSASPNSGGRKRSISTDQVT